MVDISIWELSVFTKILFVCLFIFYSTYWYGLSRRSNTYKISLTFLRFYVHIVHVSGSGQHEPVLVSFALMAEYSTIESDFNLIL